jgi:sigma-B regulation protein RsbU (phosphoserine phosphatase)
MRIVIADAMGKGLPAGLLMSNLQGALRVLSSELESPAELVGRLNGWLCRNVPVTKFISLVCVGLTEVNAEDTDVTYTNAGHCPPILIRKNGDIERLEVTGGILGVYKGFTYGQRSLSLRFGDAIPLYTDGIVECENADGEQYEETRLVEYLRDRRKDPADEIISSLVADVLGYTGAAQPPDDLTAILLRKI